MTLLNILLWLVPVVLALALIWLLRGALTRFSDGLRVIEAYAERLTAAPATPQNGNDNQQELSNLRLQACERFTLMLERISIPNLLLRMPAGDEMSGREYTANLLLAIRQEFEYNITQQIYVSDSLWSIITQSRDNISLLISRAAEGATDSRQIMNRLRVMSTQQPEDGIALAQGAIRREATSVLAK